MSESKYADRLRNLGFAPLPPELQERYDQRVMTQLERLAAASGKALNRKRRRAAATKLLEPRFTVTRDASGAEDTFATDDHGVHWHVKKAVSLAFMGFTNNAAPFASEFAKTMRDGATIN